MSRTWADPNVPFMSRQEAEAQLVLLGYARPYVLSQPYAQTSTTYVQCLAQRRASFVASCIENKKDGSLCFSS